ncbi:hypothetical protein BHM03_00049743 [Ensete ventricosum]|nr:hypothetical protein BHM03_00049743 [Ensete ventricosum]
MYAHKIFRWSAPRLSLYCDWFKHGSIYNWVPDTLKYGRRVGRQRVAKVHNPIYYDPFPSLGQSPEDQRRTLPCVHKGYQVRFSPKPGSIFGYKVPANLRVFCSVFYTFRSQKQAKAVVPGALRGGGGGTDTDMEGWAASGAGDEGVGATEDWEGACDGEDAGMHNVGDLGI